MQHHHACQPELASPADVECTAQPPAQDPACTTGSQQFFQDSYISYAQSQALESRKGATATSTVSQLLGKSVGR